MQHNTDYCTVFDANQCCYLSSEADEVLEELDENTVYIIGGIVDHNSQKGLCKRLADEKGVRTARLPIDRHVSCIESDESNRLTLQLSTAENAQSAYDQPSVRYFARV